jgi:hypothetical protein
LVGKYPIFLIPTCPPIGPIFIRTVTVIKYGSYILSISVTVKRKWAEICGDFFPPGSGSTTLIETLSWLKNKPGFYWTGAEGSA